MPQKHLKRKKRPMWILYSLASVALIFATVAMIRLGTSRADKPEGTEPSTPDVTPAPTQAELDQQRAEVLAQADTLAKGYFYDEALTLLNQNADLVDEQTQAKAAEIESAKAALVKYEGEYYHVFFHSLIVYPELAFDNKGAPADGYNMWMTTVSEFQKMLPLLLENNFILYDLRELISTDPTTGKTTQKDIYLPEGKKPLVMSVDDLNYYDYMAPDGFAQKLVINDKGDVVTRVKAPDGTVSDTYDGDVVPILDEFVKEHPEFSWRGAKGVVAPTGYQGAFGYRITDLELYSQEEGQQMLADVQAIAKRLDETGWAIASHSYTHNGYWRGEITMDELKSDLTRWRDLIGAYTGPTNILIIPFGAHYDPSDERYQYFVEQGFNIICPVGAAMTTKFYDNSMLQDRLDLDGYTMIKHPERISKHFFDPALVLDPSRPPME